MAEAIEILADGDGLGLGKRRITVSTSGVVPEIEKLGREVGPKLAISLHAVRDDLRDVLAHQQEVSHRRADGGLPHLSGRLQCQAHHLRYM